MTPTRIRPYFDDYAAFHRTRGNERCHYFGISAIVISLLGLLAPRAAPRTAYRLAVFPPGRGRHSAPRRLGWYFYLDWKLAAPFALISYGLLLFGRAIPFPALWALFVAGWVLQFIGHYALREKIARLLKNLGPSAHRPDMGFWPLTGLSTT